MKKFSFIYVLLSINIGYSAPKLQNEFVNLIGKRIIDPSVQEWLQKNDFKNSVEEFSENGPSINFKNYEKGYVLNFDINMMLYSVTLHRKGARYSGYTGKLPYNLKFGMNQDSLYRNSKLKLEISNNNQYVLIYKLDKLIVELYFGSSGLNQIYISPLYEMPIANDYTFVRLVSNGKVISGDCDSLTGEMSWNDGSATYTGEWKNKMPYGKGFFKDKYNNTYKGEFKYGYFWGKGELKVSGYYTYYGDFLISRRHGTGTCLFEKPKGESYEGQWLSDKMNGLGKYIVNSNFYYYGNILDNQFNGKGKLTTAEGWIEGDFLNGMPNGYMVQYIKLKNLTIEGNWINGKREGKFKVTDLETKKITYKKFEKDIEVD
ncbi:MAG: hypothetical protein IT243_07425 [Bacteroidia bacterium]|nr:hypothetical protein [Bacteroidia bacterium]